MIEIRKITGKLGEKEYEITEAGFVISRPWKKRLMEEIKPLFGQISDAPNIEFETPADLFKLFPLVESILIDGVATIFELLIAYSPVLQADQEYIANHATERQIVALFREVVLLADPFGVIAKLSSELGRKAIGISSNLQSANGDSA